MLSWLVNIFHANLLRYVQLTVVVLRNPMPPFCFGRHILSHATSGKPFSVLFSFQKNSRLTLSMLLATTKVAERIA